jgi:type IV secretory pathway VirB9-like protein
MKPIRTLLLIQAAALLSSLAISAPIAIAQTAAQQMTSYRLKGAVSIRPARIGDDGSKTYIQWDDDQPIPAVFALDNRGREQIVDGYMRGDLFTIDRVYQRLVFRIDKDRAEAIRVAPERNQS